MPSSTAPLSCGVCSFITHPHITARHTGMISNFSILGQSRARAARRLLGVIGLPNRQQDLKLLLRGVVFEGLEHFLIDQIGDRWKDLVTVDLLQFLKLFSSQFVYASPACLELDQNLFGKSHDRQIAGYRWRSDGRGANDS